MILYYGFCLKRVHLLLYSLNQIYLHYVVAHSFGSTHKIDADAVPPPPEEKQVKHVYWRMICFFYIPQSTPKRNRNCLKKFETEKTRPLSNGELQHLVLLKQFKVLELKGKTGSWRVGLKLYM